MSDDLPIKSDDIPILGRSELERWTICPWMAQQIESGRINTHSDAANSGEQAHRAIGKTVEDFITNLWFVDSLREITSTLEEYLQKSRPDVQPDVLNAVRPSVWMICKMLHHNFGRRSGGTPDDILRFDGGEGERSGQLSYDLMTDWGEVRITAELDLLTRGAGMGQLDIYDWKTGRGRLSSEGIRDSFQLGCWYPWLVWRNYPADCDVVTVRVLNTRFNAWAGPVLFRERDFVETERRIVSAAGTWARYNRIRINPDSEHKDGLVMWETGAPRWPSREKCRICDCAGVCPEAGQEAAEITQDPREYLRVTAALESILDNRKAVLRDYTDEHGPVRADGLEFGRNKPPSSRKPAAQMYEVD